MLLWGCFVNCLMKIFAMYFFNRGHELDVHNMIICETYMNSPSFIHSSLASEVSKNAFKACDKKFTMSTVYFSLGAPAFCAKEELQNSRPQQYTSVNEYKILFLTKVMLIILFCILNEVNWIDWDVAMWYSVQNF